MTENHSTKACFDSSFHICDGTYFFTRACQDFLPLLQKLPLFLIYKYITWVLNCSLAHTKEHTFLIQALPGGTHWDVALLFFHSVLQYLIPENPFLLTFPEGTNEEEFCFSFESLQGVLKILGNVWEQKELNIPLSSLPVIIFPPPLIPLLWPLTLTLSMNWFCLITLHTCPPVWLHSYLSLSHRHRYTNHCLLFFSFSICHTHTNTHRHSNQIRQSCIFEYSSENEIGIQSQLSARLHISISGKL